MNIERFPLPDRRLFDRFDAYPSTANIIAIDEGCVIGGVRFAEETELGIPADEYFDFSPHLPGDVVKLGGGSMFCLERKYRRFPQLTFVLMGMGYSWAMSRGVSHILGVMNPRAEHFFLRNGYRPVATKMYDKKKRLFFIPIILSLRELSNEFQDFVKRQQGDRYWLPVLVTSPSGT